MGMAILPILSAVAPETMAGLGLSASFFGAAAGAAGANAGLFSAGTGLLGTGIQAIGQYQQGQAASESAKYNSQVAENNATIARQNAVWAGQEGEANAAAKEQQTRATLGSIKAAQGANGVDVNSGSNLDVRSSAEQLGELDAINIRANAARSAYGYQTTASNQEAQSGLDKYEAESSSTAGDIGAGASLLTGSGNAGLGYERYLTNSGFTG